jgi:hypothetical protein
MKCSVKELMKFGLVAGASMTMLGCSAAGSNDATVGYTNNGNGGRRTGGDRSRQSAGTAGALVLTDAAATPSDLCIENPSFEGPPGVLRVPPNWTTCQNTPDTNPSAITSTIASNGATYLGLDAETSNREFAGAELCAALVGGQSTFLAIDLGKATLASVLPGRPNAPASLQIWGGTNSCRQDELLWTSPTISGLDTWKTYCATLTPSKDYRYVVLAPLLDLGTPPLALAYVLVDNIVPVPSCP